MYHDSCYHRNANFVKIALIQNVTFLVAFLVDCSTSDYGPAFCEESNVVTDSSDSGPDSSKKRGDDDDGFIATRWAI